MLQNKLEYVYYLSLEMYPEIWQKGFLFWQNSSFLTLNYNNNKK